jgi:glutathionylspermidine synthase
MPSTDLGSWLSDCGVPSLPFVDGNPRLRSSPCVIPSRRMKALRAAAIAVHGAYDNLCDIVADNPSHLGGFFGLTPLQKMLWYSSGSLWHGISRADIFCTKEGALAVAEVNSDTPSGVDEAFLLGEFAAPGFPGFLNPNRDLREGFLSVINDAYRSLRSRAARPAVGLVYPTDIPEDQGMIILYQRWLEEAGFTVTIGSPSNVDRGENGRATMFGTEIDVLFRHYKTDWWCERVNVWKDARPIPDAGPLLGELENVIQPMVEGDLAVVNPFGAVVTQNKLSLAFFHEKIALFSEESRDAIERYIPLTRRLSSFEPGTLEREKDDWVLKSDYGCEGAEVIVGRLTGEEAWTNALGLAEPSHWVAQRYFQAEVDDSGFTENYGVYLAGGKPAGMYVRLARGITGSTAVVAPALERPPLAGTGAHAPSLPGTFHGCNERVRGLIRSYTPGEAWLPFRMSLLLYSAADPELVGACEMTRDLSAACEAGSVLGGLLAGADEAARNSLLILSDIDGVESVALASGLAREADIVIQMENIAHRRESVPLRPTLGALSHFASLVESGRSARGAERKRTGAFILDRRRMDPPEGGAGQFNNRHWAFLPTVRALEERHVDTILYILPGGAAAESDDLNEDFIQYALGGVRLCYATPGEILAREAEGLGLLLRSAERTPVRRQTVFTYMLPRESEITPFAYNQEAAGR